MPTRPQHALTGSNVGRAARTIPTGLGIQCFASRVGQLCQFSSGLDRYRPCHVRPLCNSSRLVIWGTAPWPFGWASDACALPCVSLGRGRPPRPRAGLNIQPTSRRPVPSRPLKTRPRTSSHRPKTESLFPYCIHYFSRTLGREPGMGNE